MKMLKIYGNLADAELDRSRLARDGIPAFVAGEHTGTIGYGGMFGEVRLEVADEDWERAVAVLNSPPNPLPEDAVFEGGES